MNEQPTPGDVYTFAAAVADCPTHRVMLAESTARYATYGESIRRRDRAQLGLRIATPRPDGAA